MHQEWAGAAVHICLAMTAVVSMALQKRLQRPSVCHQLGFARAVLAKGHAYQTHLALLLTPWVLDAGCDDDHSIIGAGRGLLTCRQARMLIRALEMEVEGLLGPGCSV